MGCSPKQPSILSPRTHHNLKNDPRGILSSIISLENPMWHATWHNPNWPRQQQKETSTSTQIRSLVQLSSSTRSHRSEVLQHTNRCYSTKTSKSGWRLDKTSNHPNSRRSTASSKQQKSRNQSILKFFTKKPATRRLRTVPPNSHTIEDSSIHTISTYASHNDTPPQRNPIRKPRSAAPDRTEPSNYKDPWYNTVD